MARWARFLLCACCVAALAIASTSSSESTPSSTHACDGDAGECRADAVMPPVDAASSAADASTMQPQERTASIPEFVPTKEWKVVGRGQPVPPGLHIRMNLATGLREAKLISEDDEDGADVSVETTAEAPSRTIQVSAGEKSSAAVITVATDVSGDAVSVQDSADTAAADSVEVVAEESEPQDKAPASEEPNWNDEKIYEVLRALPLPPQVDGMDLDEARGKMSAQEFRLHMIKLWKQRQIDLKEAMDSMQDDATYFGKLLTQLEDATKQGSITEQLRILEVLEWEVGDLDKTQIFNFIGGFRIVGEYLNATNLPVRAHASWLLGTAVKNYKEAQEWAVNAGVVPNLLESLAFSAQDTQGWTKSEVFELKKKALYALSSLIRFNPRAQRLFLSLDGPEHLAGLFAEGHPANLQLKAVLFVHDLLHEPAPDQVPATSDDNDNSALPQLQALFRSTAWCQRTAEYFLQQVLSLGSSSAAQVLTTLTQQLPACQEIFADVKVQPIAQTLQTRWSTANDLEAEERQELVEIVRTLLSQL